MRIEGITWGLGSLIAIVVLLIAIVLMVIGRLDYTTGLLIAGLAVSRLV